MSGGINFNPVNSHLFQWIKSRNKGRRGCGRGSGACRGGDRRGSSHPWSTPHMVITHLFSPRNLHNVDEVRERGLIREGAGRNFRSGNESQDAKICICLPDVGLSTLGPDEEVKEMTHKQVTGSHWESGISLSSKLGSVSLKPNGIPDTQRQTEARSVRPP